MPTISDKIITARKPHHCTDCSQGDPHIEVGEKHHRIYGYACQGDPPWVMRRHIDCRRADLERGYT